MSMGIVNKDTAATIPAAGNTGDKVGNLAALHTTVKSDIVAAVNEVKDEMPEKTDNDAVAPEFNDTTAYSTGELVYKDGQLYKFDSDHAAGAWDVSEVSPTTVAAEFNQLKNTLIAFPDYADWTLILDNNTVYPYTYTTPKDGFIIVNRLISNVSGTKLAINGLSITALSNDVETTGGMYPVKKNDTVIFNGLTTASRAYFVPFRS